MSIFLPSKETKKWSVSQEGDLWGHIIRPRNLDFNKKGYLSLARKPYVIYTESEDADFQAPIAIVSDDNNVYVITSDHAFRIDSDAADVGVVEINAGSPPNFGFQSDAVFFTADMHASGTTMVCSYNLSGDTWTSRITGLSSSYPHPLCVSEHQVFLAVGNGNTVALYNTSYALQTTLTIPSAYVVTWIRWKANILYVGTRNVLGGEAKVFLWNGSGTAAQAAYGVGADWAFSGCEYGSTIAVVNSIGQVLVFAGDGFVPLKTDDGREVYFPVYNTGIPWGSSASTSNLVGKMASRGMVAKGRRIFMVVNGEMSFTGGGVSSYIHDFPSGLWVFDPAVGLYHKAGFDHKKHSAVQPSSVASDILTLPSAQIFETGDPVLLSSGPAGLTGDIASGRMYYAIKVSSTQLKLAHTPQQALAGLNISVGGTPTSLDKLAFNVYQSVGATRIERAGGINLIQRLGMYRYTGLEVIYGGEVENAVGSTVGAVMSLGMGKNVGSFITPKIQASAVTDIFKKLIAKFPPMNISSRKIIIKYRKKMRWGIPGRGDMGSNGEATWVNSTSFTINPKNYDFYSAANGDEIEFTSGSAAGYTAHISNIAQDSTTQWTITIDEAMPDVAASDVSTFIVNNWTKYKTISTSDDAKAAAQGFKNMALAKNAKWIQLKIELRGYADIDDTMDLEETMLINAQDQKYA